MQRENITTQKRAMVQYEKCATWKSCKIKKYELLQWSTRKVHENIARITGRPLEDRYTLVFSHKMLPLTFAISDDYLIFGANTVNRCEQLLPEAQAI